ncbi:MAG: menaquinol oxidoreductase [Calditrichaeota bacterium]|nr:menaquinol oxidoreductase [Calditrichota bacterium]
MRILFSLAAVLALLLVAYVGVAAAGGSYFFLVVFPYLALAAFFIGIIYRILKWAGAPVPFHIPTTCGQQKSLGWIKPAKLEAPSTTWQVIGRMALEILLFRSLFRNTKAERVPGEKVVYGSCKWLWAAGLAFHWSFLIVFIRHLRLFLEPIPQAMIWLENLDGFFQVSVPGVLITDIILLSAITFLFLRRIFSRQIRYISLAADYFPLFLIFGIAATGVLMRHFFKVDLKAVKQFAIGLVSFSPLQPEGLGIIFYLHIFLVFVLIAYFPFSKLMHIGGIFLSPTRNLANNSRAVRHINLWNPKVKMHSYQEWEDEFHDLIIGAGLPLDKE